MSSSSSSFRWVIPVPSQASGEPSKSSFLSLSHIKNPICRSSNYHLSTLSCRNTKATLDEKDPILVAIEKEQEQEEEEPSKKVLESVRLLKDAAKTRKVPAVEVISALSVIEEAKINPSGFFETLGGTESPGRTWMLVFTAEKKLARGRYFPITAVQRFDAAAKRIENGVYLGPLGWLAFEGRLSWKKRILAFIFEKLRIKFGPLNPVEINFKGKEEREPGNKDPFFIWFYIDEEIAVARGRSGGTAFWVRCRRVSSY